MEAISESFFQSCQDSTTRVFMVILALHLGLGLLRNLAIWMSPMGGNPITSKLGYDFYVNLLLENRGKFNGDIGDQELRRRGKQELLAYIQAQNEQAGQTAQMIGLMGTLVGILIGLNQKEAFTQGFSIALWTTLVGVLLSLCLKMCTPLVITQVATKLEEQDSKVIGRDK